MIVRIEYDLYKTKKLFAHFFWFLARSHKTLRKVQNDGNSEIRSCRSGVGSGGIFRHAALDSCELR